MCQITLVKSELPMFNKLLVIQQALINSAKLNKHGWGISDGRTLWKTEICPHDLLNGGLILNRVKLQNTVVSHVRAATSGIPVTREMAHPFVNGNFTLVHNGSITLRSGEHIVGSDSERFLEEMVKIHATGKTVPESIVEAQKLFWGPFVYVINHEEDWYIARGFGRSIHKAVITVKRIKDDAEFPVLILNSDKDDLAEGVQVVRNICPLIGYEVLDKSVIPAPLVMETIYKLDGYELVGVGHVKEETAPVRTTTTAMTRHYGDEGSYYQRPAVSTTKPPPDEYDKIVEWMETNVIDFGGLDYILYAEYGAGLLEISTDMWNDFITKIMPRYNLNGGTRAFVLKRIELPIPPSLLLSMGLNYPIAANDHNAIVKALKELK